MLNNKTYRHGKTLFIEVRPNKLLKFNMITTLQRLRWVLFTIEAYRKGTQMYVGDWHGEHGQYIRRCGH